MNGKHTWWVVAAIVALLAPLVFLWWRSLPPDSYSVMDMGRPDFGGGRMPSQLHNAAHARSDPARHAAARSVADLKDPSTAPADVRLTLTARRERLRLAGGLETDGYTLNGQSPGPTINAVRGQVIEVTLVNDNVTDGTTLHWHGVDVPGAEDGVAGVTQDAVMPGQSYKYRFTAQQAGTFWYHSHQVSHQQVIGGLLGALVIAPAPGATDNDVVAVAHTYGSRRTINGASGDTTLPAPSAPTRIRVINSDNGPIQVWTSGGEYRVLAVDGTEVNQPGGIRDETVQVTAGSRVDLEISGPARVDIGGAALVFGTPPPPGDRPVRSVDLLTYGHSAPIGFDPEQAHRRFDYRVGRFPGFVNGRPGMWWTVNGRLFPEVPMFVVSRGDIVRMTISNTSGELHPMHLHGHHAVVLSRNGVRATGGPWWFDSLNVGDNETYEVAFIADNPGIWMDHCHQLQHAADGLVAHLMYEDVTTPFRIGTTNGNHPE